MDTRFLVPFLDVLLLLLIVTSVLVTKQIPIENTVQQLRNLPKFHINLLYDEKTGESSLSCNGQMISPKFLAKQLELEKRSGKKAVHIEAQTQGGSPFRFEKKIKQAYKYLERDGKFKVQWTQPELR